MFEGFFRNIFDRGLSKVEAEDPETKEGVRMFGGGIVGGRSWRAEPTTSDCGIIDDRLGAGGICAAVTEEGALSEVPLVPWPDFSDGVILRLALFANFDTCCAVLLLLSVLLLGSVIGVRLDCLRCTSVVGCAVLLLK